MPRYEYGEMRGLGYENGHRGDATSSIMSSSQSSIRTGRYTPIYSKQVVWCSGGGVTRLRLWAWGGRRKHTRYELMRTVQGTPVNIWARALEINYGRRVIIVSAFRAYGLIGLMTHKLESSGKSIFPPRLLTMRCVIGLAKIIGS